MKLHHRVFLISRYFAKSIVPAKGNNAVRCGRDYSSSSPVKYIPKNSSKSDEDGAASLSVKYVEKRHDWPELKLARAVCCTDSSEGFSDLNSGNRGACRAYDTYGLNAEMEEENESDISASNYISNEKTETVVEDKIGSCNRIQSVPREAVEKLAIELLASRAFTGMELKKKLQAKKFPLDMVEAVISNFQTRGLINDLLYAETYSQSRWSSSSWGPRRIKQALSKKGISEVDTKKAIKLLFESNEGDEDQDSSAMSRPALDRLYAQASKQWHRSRVAPHDTRKSRIVRWLRYRGFDWKVVSHVVKKLESGE